jgi:hypothetical protein
VPPGNYGNGALLKLARSQIELPSQQLKCGRCDLIWVLTKLAIKVRMVMCIHTALENLSIHGSVKEPCRNPQCAYVITASPSFTNFATL